MKHMPRTTASQSTLPNSRILASLGLNSPRYRT